MNDHPNALELIQIANQTLLSEVLPDAKAEHLYALRMISNALGIAARELGSQADHSATESLGLDALYGKDKNTDSALVRNRQFATDIRHGKFEHDAATEAQVRRHLLATAHTKLAVAYPKGLASK